MPTGARGTQRNRTDPPPPRKRGNAGSAAGDYKKVFRGSFRSYNAHSPNENDNIFAGLCYILTFVCSIIILVIIKPMSPWLRFHAIQSMAMSIIMFGTWIALNIIFLPFRFLFKGFCLPDLIQLVLLGIWIYMIVVAVLCFIWKDHRAPYLADWVEKNFV